MDSDLCTIGRKYSTCFLLITKFVDIYEKAFESLTPRRLQAKKVERGYHRETSLSRAGVYLSAM